MVDFQPFVGEIGVVGFNFAPRGFALCEGQLMPIHQNTALFSILGTTYGGDGRTTFALPDLRGRAAVAQGAGPGLSDWLLGERRGTETVTLSGSTMPAHTHRLGAATLADRTSPENAVFAGGDARRFRPGVIGGFGLLTTVGSGQPHENRQPFLVLTYVIALQGIFPPRD